MANFEVYLSYANENLSVRPIELVYEVYDELQINIIHHNGLTNKSVDQVEISERSRACQSGRVRHTIMSIYLPSRPYANCL